MDMELLQKALFNLPRLQGNSDGANRSVEKLGQLYSAAAAGSSSQEGMHHHHQQQQHHSGGNNNNNNNGSNGNVGPLAQPPSASPPIVEAVSPNIVFDVASLVLYGTHAIPVRLKILMDRLFSVLSNEEVAQILKGYGWTMEDYQRGYILKDSRGAPLERWQMCSKEEEPLVLQQFLRFGETRPITQALILQELSEKSNEEFRARTEIKKLIERNSLVAAAAIASSQAPPTPVARSSPSPLGRSSPGRHSSPGRRTPSILSSPQQGPSPPSSNGGPPPVSPLNKLQNIQPFDYRSKERKTPEVPSSMRIPPTSMAAAAAAGLAGMGALPPMLPNVSHSLANYHNSITHMAKAQQELSRAAQKEHHHSEGSKKESSSFSAPQRPDSGKNSPSSREEDSNGGLGLISQEIRKKMRDNIGISYVNPSTGKKRVQCNVCLKTFCDKGALKIHFSAVHLREMHKCSVEGCNMMFSSRRSRNRHSANPNPKLHTPHLRRKISPHDGRTHQGPSIIPYHTAALSVSPGKTFPGAGLLPPGFNHQAFAAAAAANQGLIPPPELLHRQQMELQRLHEMKLNSLVGPRRDCKRIRLSDSENEGEPKEEEEPQAPLPAEASSSQRGLGGRKRKSQNPTRLKVSSDGDGEEFSSDDDDEGFENPMDDDDDELGDTDDDDHRNNPGNSSSSNAGSGNPGNSRSSPSKKEEEDDNRSEAASKTGGPEDANPEDNNNSKVGSIKVLSDEKLLLRGSEEEPEEDEDIPLDTENPKRCVECGNEFESHFLLKAHYTADHLKLHHKCSIEGCNAGFPSKRSRDRHSANHNLHRKLLSTETTGFQNEVMARLYGGEAKAQLPPLFFGMPHPFFGNGPFFRPPLIPPPHHIQHHGSLLPPHHSKGGLLSAAAAAAAAAASGSDPIGNLSSPS